jgi:hypothetical protein
MNCFPLPVILFNMFLSSFLLWGQKKGALIDASKEIDLEVNTEKTKYVDVPSPECKEKS